MNGPDAAGSGQGSEGKGGDGREKKESNPFAEYMWMENEEDFDRQVEEELQEQEFLDRCFQEMLDEEDQEWFIPSRDLPQRVGQLQQQLNGLCVADGRGPEDVVVGSCHAAALGGGGWKVSFGVLPDALGAGLAVGQLLANLLINQWSTTGQPFHQPLANCWPTAGQPLANPFISS
uniref:Poly(A) binding protein interacting protein 2B n=1 Tax=Chrysolophus pictus TaxID=9089 RepID=A0A8C3LX40_CHRPC